MPTTNELFVAHNALGGGSTPATTNDGLDRFGWNIAAGAFTTATKTLTKVGTWATYTWTSGDRIGITGGTGVTAGSYAIASKVDDDSITLTEDIGGANPADVTSSTGAWGDATEDTVGLQHAVDTAATKGDRVNICHDANWTLNATIDFDTNAGNADGGIVYRGVNSRGLYTGDSTGTAVIDASALGAAVDAFDIGIADWRCTMMDIRISGDLTDPATTGGGGRRGIRIPSGITNPLGGFIRIRIHHMGDSGFFSGAGGGQTLFKDCEFDHNGDDGYEAAAAAQGSAIFYGCSSHHNVDDGFVLGGDDSWSLMTRTLSYRNGGQGVTTLAGVTNGRYAIEHCTIFANTGDGLELEQNAGSILHSSIIKDSGALGINVPSSNWSRIAEARTNLFDGNGTGDAGWDTDEVSDDPFSDNVTTDPDFKDETDGTEQLYPNEGSPAIAADVAQKVR